MAYLTYGQKAAIRRAREASKRRADAKKPKERKKSKNPPIIEWHPLLDYSYRHTQDSINWDEPSFNQIAVTLADRLENEPNMQLLVMPTGFGKTSETVRALSVIQERRGHAVPFCVVMPPKALEGEGWHETIAAWNGTHPAQELDPYVITSFERFSNILKDARSRAKFKRGFPEDGIIVIDEVQGYKNPTSKRSKTMQLIPKYKRLGLSATPLTNDMMMDIGSYLILAGYYPSKRQFLIQNDLEVFEDERKSGLDVYDKTGHIIRERVFEYNKLMGQMATVLYKPSIVVRDMPHVDLSVIQLPESEQLHADMRSIGDAYKQRMFESQADMRYVLEERIALDPERLDALLDIVCGENVKQPLIFFSHRFTSERLGILLKERGIDYQILDGRNHMQGLDQESLAPILIQYKAGAAAIEFKNSNCSVFYENQPSYIDLVQGRGRNVRRGMTQRVSQYMLVSSNAYDSEVFSRVHAKEEVNPQTLDEIARRAVE